MFKAWYNSPRALGFSIIASKEAEVHIEHPETSRQGEDSRWSPEYHLKRCTWLHTGLETYRPRAPPKSSSQTLLEAHCTRLELSSCLLRSALAWLAHTSRQHNGVAHSNEYTTGQGGDGQRDSEKLGPVL